MANLSSIHYRGESIAIGANSALLVLFDRRPNQWLEFQPMDGSIGAILCTVELNRILEL